MDKKEIKNIIIAFPNETSVLRCEKELTLNGIKSKIISVPARISAGCGMALRVEHEHKEACEKIIKDKNLKCEGIYDD